jgi:hypothetical protein
MLEIKNPLELKLLSKYKTFYICGVLVNEFSESYLNGFNIDKAKYLYRTQSIELSTTDHGLGKYFMVIYSKNMVKLIASDKISYELLGNIAEYCSQCNVTRTDFFRHNNNCVIENFESSMEEKKKILVSYK